MKKVIFAITRFLLGPKRPSKIRNTRLLLQRGETLSSLNIREVTPADIPQLAHLHVVTWNATYPGVRRKPTYVIREYQWRQAFEEKDGSWFCFVIENRNGQLVGFVKGKVHDDGSGELNKIYLLPEYQRLGIGRRLVGYVVRRFFIHNISSMSLYADPGNPSCRFFEALGTKNLREPNGKVNYSWYVWRDLRSVASICPIE